MASAVSERFSRESYRDLAFGTGGLRGVIGAGTNRMNIYTVAKASQGLADYLKKNFAEPSVAIGYDSRIKSDVFAKVAAGVFAANGVKVNIWPVLMPVPTVSFATRYLHTSAGVMVTASHNPSKYNGYKVYGADGCQITTEAAAEILAEIEKLDTMQQLCIGVTRRKFFIGLTHVAAARCGKGDDCFALQIIAFQKCIDDRRSNIPPDRESDKDGVVFVHVITLGSDGRARGKINHFDGAAGFPVHPVQIGLGVRNFRLNLKNVCTDSIGKIFSNLCGNAAGGEVSNKSFAHDKCNSFD